MTSTGRNHGFSPRVVALKAPTKNPPPVAPACGGATRAHRVAKYTSRVNRENILHEQDSLWHAYASGSRRCATNVRTYLGSIQDRDHDRS
jgi:hypothetical protein